MPHIRIRSVPLETIAARSESLVAELTAAVGCDPDWFTLECVPTTYVRKGTVARANPFVEVLWFAREPEIKKKVARILADALKGEAEYATVVFFDLKEGDYFENGEPV